LLPADAGDRQQPSTAKPAATWGVRRRAIAAPPLRQPPAADILATWQLPRCGGNRNDLIPLYGSFRLFRDDRCQPGFEALCYDLSLVLKGDRDG
jgi:hypothetical protein